MKKTISKILILIIILVSSISTLLFLSGCSTGGVTDFESCVATGNPVMESYPMQCRTKDGRTFVQEIKVPSPFEGEQTLCLENQRNADICTMEYGPVCGYFGQNIQCIRAPCAREYDNSCLACSDENVVSWSEGKCE